MQITNHFLILRSLQIFFILIVQLCAQKSVSDSVSDRAQIPDTTNKHQLQTKHNTTPITISTVPDSVTVIVDEVIKGKSPITINDIDSGNHNVTLLKKGYFLKKIAILVEPNKHNSYTFTLTQPAQLIITSEPSEALVFLNQVQQGVTPFFSDKIKPDDYIVTLTKAGYDDLKINLKLTDGGKDSIQVSLQKNEKLPQTTHTDVVQQQSPIQPDKLNKMLDKVSIATFVLFSAIILLLEMSQGS